MSYILEALKKAEAERNTGGIPNPAIAPSVLRSAALPGTSRHIPWSWLALATAAGALVAAIWLRPAARPETAAVPAVPAAPAVAAVETAPAPSVTALPEGPADAVHESAPVKQEAHEEKPAKTKNARKATVKKTPATEPIATLAELPGAIQQQIPALKVGGYIYSANQADRSVLINGRLLREGDEVAPGLILEQMQRNGMVLSYKGYHYRRGY